jgi:gamma-tubulin complex component 3
MSVYLKFVLSLALIDRQMSDEDSGWDVFSLTYHVDTPINTIFTQDNMFMYLRLFNFLWRLKRVEYSLVQTWMRQMTARRYLSSLKGA